LQTGPELGAGAVAGVPNRGPGKWRACFIVAPQTVRTNRRLPCKRASRQAIQHANKITNKSVAGRLRSARVGDRRHDILSGVLQACKNVCKHGVGSALGDGVPTWSHACLRTGFSVAPPVAGQTVRLSLRKSDQQAAHYANKITNMLRGGLGGKGCPVSRYPAGNARARVTRLQTCLQT
jgi:hypothetical protein